MNALTKVDKLIIDKLLDLPINDKSEVLNFIEFVRIRQDRSFIDYVKDLANSKDINCGDRDILIKLKEIVHVIVPTATVLLYGSVARGTQDEDSDSDGRRDMQTLLQRRLLDS